MLELKQQLSLLKQQLANTESVQKDFVELSQSLQVREREREMLELKRNEIYGVLKCSRVSHQSRLVEVESRQQEEEHRSLSSSQGSTHN